MNKSSIPDNVISSILSEEKSYVRFEHFCCDLFSDVKGFNYVPTSQSYDLGRDGRDLSQQAIICCTLEDKIDKKSIDDVQRMLTFWNPNEIAFCTSKSKSESYLHKIQEQIKKVAPNVEHIEIYSSTQLIALIQNYPNAFENRYFAELRNCQSFMSKNTFYGEEKQKTGLRLALATQFHEDASKLRLEVLNTAILFVLSKEKQKTISGIAKSVSDSLHLPKIIHKEYFRRSLDELIKSSLIEVNENLYNLTAQGEEVVKQQEASSTNKIDEGEKLFKKEIERLLELTLDQNEFARIWKRIQDKLANLFFTSGLKIVQVIASLTTHKLPKVGHTYKEVLDNLQKSIASIGGGGPHGEEIAQAIIDLLKETDSPAFKWITDVAINYVTFCSLGLEPNAQQEIAGRLKDIDIIIDTDILLSYLLPGERRHHMVVEIINRWKDIGKCPIVVPSVIEEVAYHAWISDFDYQRVWQDLNTYTPLDVDKYVENAFVRAFYYESKNKGYHKKNWKKFISEYKGNIQGDVTKIKEILDELDFEIVHNHKGDNKFINQVVEEIYKVRNMELSSVQKKMKDKIFRDGRLLDYLRYKRSSFESSYKTANIVSSSQILEKVSENIIELQSSSSVWSIGAIAYLISLIPGTRMTLNSLRCGLFTDYDAGAIDRITRLALRVIKRSEEYELGYSRRITLKKAISNQIRKVAEQVSIAPEKLSQEIIDGSEKEDIAVQIIAEGVDDVIASKSEKVINDLKDQLQKNH